LPRSPVARVCCAPFLPGGARGLLYALVSLVVLALFVTLFLPQLTVTNMLTDRQGVRYSIALASYSLIYLGAGTCLARQLRRLLPSLTSLHVLATLVLANILLVVAAQVIHFLSRDLVPTTQFYDVVNPFQTLRMISDAGAGAVDAVACLVVCAVVALAANGRALLRGVFDVVNDPVRAQLESQAEPAGIAYRQA
jgi:hypothetical protein